MRRENDLAGANSQTSEGSPLPARGEDHANWDFGARKGNTPDCAGEWVIYLPEP